MKGLKKIALASAIAAVSAGAQAELKALDDSAMGELTGQAGLTIDLETKYTIGEFMYKDAGSVFLQGISLGARDGETGYGGLTGLVDNIRIKLDIAGSGATDAAGLADNELDTGFSRVRDLADIMANVTGNADSAKYSAAAAGGDDGTTALTLTDVAGAIEGMDAGRANLSGNATNSLEIRGKKTYDNGDLLIHVSFKDAWQKTAAGSLAGNMASGAILGLGMTDLLTAGLKSVDFNFSIDAIGLASSDFQAGDSIGQNLSGYQNAAITGADLDSDPTTTTLISGLSINGYLGPVDIHIENDGNGFQYNMGAAGILEGAGKADSVINWDTYVNVTDLDVYLDIAGVQITNMKINNVRGDVTDLDGNFAFGFAQSKRQIYAVKDTAGLTVDGSNVMAHVNTSTPGLDAATLIGLLNAEGVDGIAINTTFKGDKEIGALSFGDTGTSIGELYWTDIESTTNWTISAH